MVSIMYGNRFSTVVGSDYREHFTPIVHEIYGQ